MRTQHLRKHKLVCGVATCAMLINSMAPIVATAADAAPSGSNDSNTTTPIKHVIVIIGENRTFDHLFATYQPAKKGQSVLNHVQRLNGGAKLLETQSNKNGVTLP